MFTPSLPRNTQIILAFYDSRHASKALSQMQENPHQYFEGVAVTGRTPSYDELNQVWTCHRSTTRMLTLVYSCFPNPPF